MYVCMYVCMYVFMYVLTYLLFIYLSLVYSYLSTIMFTWHLLPLTYQTKGARKAGWEGREKGVEGALISAQFMWAKAPRESQYSLESLSSDSVASC